MATPMFPRGANVTTRSGCSPTCPARARIQIGERGSAKASRSHQAFFLPPSTPSSREMMSKVNRSLKPERKPIAQSRCVLCTSSSASFRSRGTRPYLMKAYTDTPRMMPRTGLSGALRNRKTGSTSRRRERMLTPPPRNAAAAIGSGLESFSGIRL